MSEEHKARVRKAMEKRCAKLAKPPRPYRKNEKPERKLQAEMLAWLNAQGCFVFPLESKAVYSSAAGRYLDSQTRVGASDILGTTPNGFFLAVEVKSHGRRSTLRDSQRNFLSQLISKGAFAVCSDSLEHLNTVLHSWLNADLSSRKTLLEKDLPGKTKEHLSSTLFSG